MLQRYAAIAALILPFAASAQTNNYPIGSTVADFTVTDTEGESYNLYDLTSSGKFVMLDFFFYDCPPCQANAPSFSEFYQTYGCNDGDIVVLEVNNGTDTDLLTEQFAGDFGGSFAHPPAVGPADGGDLTGVFGVTAFPTFCLIGTDNKIKDDDIWPLSNGMASLVASFPAGSGIQTMACVVGIREVGATISTSVFPTPSNGSITLSMDLERSGSGNVAVLDAMGQQVYTAALGTLSSGASKRTMDLTGLADGPYFLRVRVGAAAPVTQRIVIAH